LNPIHFIIVKLIMSNEINLEASSFDTSQVELDLGNIHIRDQATRDILRRQVEKGGITHSDIVTFQSFRNRWDYSVRVHGYLF
jgi:hypothetical protein